MAAVTSARLALVATMLAGPAMTGETLSSDAPPQAQPFIDDAEAWLLGGRTLPPDYRQHLLAMEPDQRLQAIVWLRRAGMLVDRAWAIEDLMRPATRPRQEAGDEPGSRAR